MQTEQTPSRGGDRSARVADAPAVPDTVRLLRESRKRKVKELAETLGKTPSYVSKVELGQLPLYGAALDDFATALDVPTPLLCEEIPSEPDEGVHFRSQSKTPQWARKKVNADANWAAFIVNRILAELDAEFPLTLPAYDVDLLEEGPKEAAQLLRRLWRLDGPIRELAGLMESAGIFILPMAPEIDTIDAITVRTRGAATAVVLLRENIADDRKRHTLAHELGHLVLDLKSSPASLKEIEERADAFAGEFLAPYAEVGADLAGITPTHLDRLENLRRRWGVTMPALIRRAFLAGDLSETQYRYWFRVLNARGLVRQQYQSTYPVRARAAHDTLVAIRASGYSPKDVVDMCRCRLGDLEATFGSQWIFARTTSHLSVVPDVTLRAQG